MRKKLMSLLVVLAVLATTAQVGQAGELITAVAERNSSVTAAVQIADDPLDEGALCFVDRTHIYVEIPEALIGAEYVMTANDNKGQSTYELDLTISRNATVYVFVDNRMGGAAGGLDVEPNIDGMPWLTDMGFVDTGMDLGIDESADGSINQYFSVFALDVKAGITTIGGCTAGHGGNMLGVAVMSRTPAESAHTPNPEDEAVDVPRDLTVGWEPGEEVTAHDVYLGTSVDDVNDASRNNPMDVLLSQGQSGTTLDVGRLDFEQTYYWRVDEVLTDGSIYHGEVWSFTVEPLAYSIAGVVATSNAASAAGEGPENLVNGSGLNADDQHSTDSADMWLVSTDGSTPVQLEFTFDNVYKLYEMLVWNYNVMFEPVLGFGVNDATIEYTADGVEWTLLAETQFAQATAKADYEANTIIDMGGIAAQAVRITINSNFGSLTQYGLSEVRFLYTPVLPREPQPSADATGVGVDAALTWRSGREAASHEVYFGADAEALALAGTVSESTFTPDALDYGATYYWQVVEVNEAEAISAWAGDVWSFATQEYGVVDDFESYTDDEGNRIYESWEDGFLNDTGSTVGYFEAPFAEQTIVNSGGQSMPLFYENAGVSTAEAELSLSQDWTTNGIKSLSLSFYGDPANTGQLYLKINGVRVDYDGAASAIATAAWQAWNIDLATVNTNLRSVTSLTIGIEGSGAEGILYIDDIRLYPKTPEYIIPVEPDGAGLLWWAFDEGSGTVATDSSGSGHDGVISGPEWTAPGALGGSALYFDGTGGIVEDDDAEDYLNGLEAITMAMWVKADAIPTDKGFIIAAPPAGADSFCTVRYDAAGATAGGTAVLKIGLTSTGGEQQLESSNNLQTTEWQHVAVTWSSGQPITLYADGIEDTPTDNYAGMVGTISGCNTLIVGQGGKDAGASWAGMIDEVRIYDRVLSVGEILWLAGQTEPVARPF